MGSAISGSSVATAATMGSVALPYFRGTHYAPRMVLGSLAAGGALGNLIPPGITFIVYALITETSVGQLYVAAIGPSLLVVALFALVFAAGAVLLVHESTTVFRIHVLIATFLGAFLSILMAGALMLLIFASNRSGHDEAVHHFTPEDDE